MIGKTKVRHRSGPGAGMFLPRPSRGLATRAAAVFLSFCVAFTMMPAPVFAAAQDPAAETGLCEHHPEHTEECGYREAEPGHPCEHEHTANCYTDEVICGFIEDEDETASDSDAGHVHTQDCYTLDCPHERGEHKVNGGEADREGDLGHTEECGYTEGEKGVPCGYVCAECGEPEETKPELVQPDAIEDRIVTSFDELDEAVRNQTVKGGTPLEELALPDTLAATAQTGDEDPEPVVIEGVAWEPDVLYEGEAGEFIFTSSAAGYTLVQGVDWPAITVTVEEAWVVLDEIEALCAAIDALPTVEELYENAPGDAAPEFIDWVTKINAKLTEVPALWKRLLALSEDTAAMEQITEARAKKLAGLHDLAEKFAERRTLEGNYVEVIGSNGQSKGNYASLGDAISNAATGDTLKLLQDIMNSSKVTISDKNLTLNLDNKKLSFPSSQASGGGAAIELAGTASLWVEGSGEISMVNTSSATLIMNRGSGTLTIKEGTISDSGQNGAVILNIGSGDVRIEGGMISASGYEKIVISNPSTGSVTVTGGTVSATNNSSYAIGNFSSGKITVGGTAKVTSSTKKQTIYLYAVPTTEPKTVLEITGGTVENTQDEGYAVYFANESGVTADNLSDYFIQSGGAITGAIYPVPKAVAPAWAASGDGTEQNPYVIDTYEQLAAFAANVSGTDDYTDQADSFESKFIKLADNFPYGGTAAEHTAPIGASDRVPFKGHFDGSGKTVNLGINIANYAGLFGYIDKGGVVEKVTVTGQVRVSSSRGGGVAGYNEGTVKNCTNKAIVAGGQNAGGVVGTNGSSGTVEACNNTETVSGTYAIGGIVGNNEGMIKKCGNIGTVTGTENETGGVAGIGQIGKVESCYNTGNVTGKCLVGGLVGNNSQSGTVKNCYNTGAVQGTEKVGGIVGSSSGKNSSIHAVVKHCVSLGTVVTATDTSSSDVGRVAGSGNGYVTLTGNQARADMEVYKNTTDAVAPENKADGVHGADLAVNGSAAMSDVFKTSDGWDTTIWTIPDGSLVYGCELPTLTGETAPTLPGEANTDATLSALTYKVGTDGSATAVPNFTADTDTYSVTLPVGISVSAHITLSGTPAAGASITTNAGVTLSGGSGTATITVTAEDGSTTKTYAVNFTTAQPTSYAVTVGSINNGTVSASPASAAAGTQVTLTVTPANGYELDTLTVYKTDETGTTVSVNNNKFTMPSYNVTVSATFKKTADQKAVESAKAIIEGGTYSVAQATANSADDVKTWLATAINSLSGMGDTGIDVQANDITVSDFTEAFADTTGSGGSDGSFKFTVSLSKNGMTAITARKDGTIIKTAYNPPQQSDAKEITAFTIAGQVGNTVINQQEHTAQVTMPAGTDVTGLTPTITVSDKASVNPASGAAQNFTNPVTYTVTAENGTTQSYTVTVTVQPPRATAPAITTQTLPGGAVGTAYSQTLAADGTTPITWSVSSGSLPDGLNLDAGTGVISGTPTAADSFTFTVKAENSKGNDTREFSIQVAAPAPTVTGVTITPATASVQKGGTQQFSATVTGTNNPAQTVTWSLDGSHADGTTITADGLLTVASDETVTVLTVKATSTVNTGKSGTAAVTVTEAPPTPTYTISGTVRGSETGNGIPATLQLKNSQNADIGTPVTAGTDGSYTITGIPAGTYHIEVSCTGYDSGTIDGIVVSNGDVTGRDLTLHKTVTFIPVAGITMTNEATVKVNTDLALAGTVLPNSATNRAIVWSVADAGGTGAIISGSTFWAEAAGTATVKAAVAGGLTATTPYEETFTIRVTTAPAPVVTHTITASAGSGGTISPNGTVTVNDGEGRTFTITPDSGYRISKVTVDGADQGTVTTYTFEHVTADHSIFVIFDRINGGGSSSEGGGSSSGGSSSSSGSSSTAPSTTTNTTAGENGTSITMTQTTSKDSSGKTTTVTTQVTKDAAGNTAGSATTVTTDNITTLADQGSAVVMIKPDGAAINGAANAAGATAADPMDILVAVPQDMVKSELQKTDVSAVRVEIILPKSAEDNPAVGTAGVTVERETVDAAKQTGKTVTVTVRDDTMAVKAVWSLDGQAMGNAAEQSTDLNLGVHTAPVQSSDPIAEPVRPTVTAAGKENGLVISLTMSGTLLSAAKLTVPATNQTAIAANSTVMLYRFDQNTGALSAIPGGVYFVDANGNVTIDIPAGTRAGVKETYVLLPVQEAAGTGIVGTRTVGAGTAGTGTGTTHTISKGDTLYQISKQYGCRVEDLLALNPGVDIYHLRIGSDLRIR